MRGLLECVDRPLDHYPLPGIAEALLQWIQAPVFGHRRLRGGGWREGRRHPPGLVARHLVLEQWADIVAHAGFSHIRPYPERMLNPVILFEVLVVSTRSNIQPTLRKELRARFHDDPPGRAEL